MKRAGNFCSLHAKMTRMNLQYLPLADLQVSEFNYNTHPEMQLAELAKSLNTFGQFRNIVVCQGRILAGHGLVEAAKRQGMTHIYALVRDDLTPQQQRALLIADNVLPTLAIPDEGKLELLLQDIPEIDIPGVTEAFWAEMTAPDTFDRPNAPNRPPTAATFPA